MRRLLLSAALAAFSMPSSSAAESPAKEIQARPVPSEAPPVNPFIYGQFIEHMGRCIYEYARIVVDNAGNVVECPMGDCPKFFTQPRMDNDVEVSIPLDAVCETLRAGKMECCHGSLDFLLA